MRLLRSLLTSVVTVATSAGIAHAAPRWCRDFHSRETADLDQVKQALDDYGGKPRNVRMLVRAATLACEAGGGDERAILGGWQRETGLDEAGALASLTARVSPTWGDDHTALCKDLEMPSGDNHDVNARADARYSLFACDTGDDVEAAWMTKPRRLPDVSPLLDRGVLDRDHDEIVRLAWVMGEVGVMLDPSEDPKMLSNYSVAQFDIHALAYDAALRQVDTAPYRGNRYAKTILAETLAHTRAQITRLDAAVATRTKDAAWRDAIMTAPQKAAADWLASASRHKDMLAHTDCAARRADVSALMKPIAATTSDIEHVESKLRDDPAAGLVIFRWGQCVADQSDNHVANTVWALAQNVPPIAGPRGAAYRAALKAAAGSRHPPFDYHDLRAPDDLGHAEGGQIVPDGFERGVIKSLKKGKKGTLVTFVPEKFRYMARDCKDTKQVDWIDDAGHVHYRQECHDAGLATGDKAPMPTTVSTDCSAGLATGRLVWLDFDVPWLVFADKSGKKIVAAYCLPLQ